MKSSMFKSLIQKTHKRSWGGYTSSFIPLFIQRVLELAIQVDCSNHGSTIYIVLIIMLIIRIPHDPIVGTDTLTLFPLDLREYLEDYGITSLAHAHNISLNAWGYWLTAEDLELGGEWKILWDKYISGLEHGRIRLNHLPDTLIWSHNKKNGGITADLVYDLISKSYLEPISNQNQILDLL